MASRLLELRRDILSLLDLYTPEVIAIEKLFFGVNAATAMNVAQARGVILSAVAEYKRDIPIHEYVPGTVKKAITGSGTATKSWMIKEVKRRLNIELKEDNEADSLAIALTCAQSL